jgi:uncharacterized protein YdhG (YjbR/CyaY superfamily)
VRLTTFAIFSLLWGVPAGRGARSNAVWRGFEQGRGTNLGSMPMQKRADISDYFAHLSADQLPHLEELRELSRAAAPDLVETLHWNNPVYLRDGVRMWMLQAFKRHCSLRFPPGWFGQHRAEAEAAGFEAGEGFIKLPYDRPLPVDLIKRLLQYRLTEFEATGAGW